MEAKKFISTLKGYKTRFFNKPNVPQEHTMVKNLVEKFGGTLDVIELLNTTDNIELKEYVKRILGVVKVKANDAEMSKEEDVKTSDKKQGKVLEEDEKGKGSAVVDGKLYKIDTVKKTLKRVYKDLKDIDLATVETEEMPMTVYQRYLKGHFEGESCTIKKGKLLFRGYRIYCSKEDGFVVEDTQNKYQAVDTPFEGIPTPKELGDWFRKPKVVHTSEELQEAVKRGKEYARKAKEEQERNAAEEEEPDFEALRRKVLRTIKDIRSKTVDFDPMKFPEMIPFRRWRRQVNSLLTQWKDKKIRYPKLINEIERITTEETFVVKEKNHKSKFVGTMLPEHTKVGMLKGDKIEVDGKWIDAVPFLLEYLLFHEKRAMSQIMKYAAGEITEKQLVENPIEVDWKVEYNKRALKNTAHNAQVLTMVYDAVGVVAPQDLLYEADLQVGDKIMLMIDGELRVRTIASVTQGITVGKEIGLLKLDRWYKIEK